MLNIIAKFKSLTFVVLIFILTFTSTLIHASNNSDSSVHSNTSDHANNSDNSNSSEMNKSDNTQSKILTLDELNKEFQVLLNKKFISGTFHQIKEIKELDVQLKSEGDFSIATSNNGTYKLDWNIHSPESLKICMDAKQVVLKSALKNSNKIKENRIVYSEMGEQSQKQLVDMVRLIQFDPKQIFSTTEIQRLPNSSNKEKGSKRYLLIPKDQKAFMFKQAEVEINKNGFMNQLLITEKSQDKLTINFSNLKSQANISGDLSKKYICP